MKYLYKGLKFTLVFLPFSADLMADEAPPLQLAKTYQPRSDIQDFFVSEKLDGVRAYWDGSQLLTRQGNVIHAPTWFTTGLPNIALDGELWIGRDRFDEVSGIIRHKVPDSQEWEKVKFMVFDLPHSLTMFHARQRELEVIVDELRLNHVRAVKQRKVSSRVELQNLLSETVAKGGEGLMLHRANSLYQASRSGDLQKLKPFDDAEAVVIAHIPGKGKYTGKMGAVLVETSDGKRFKIGSGFSLDQRATPPPIGSTITYRYRGMTKNDKPRFATFLRVYEAI